LGKSIFSTFPIHDDFFIAIFVDNCSVLCTAEAYFTASSAKTAFSVTS